MAECTFCGAEYAPGTGFTSFDRVGKSRHFCSRKCFRSLQMKRVAKKLKWTEKSKA